ncbi:MAG: glycosyltransferase family 4 protein [bacterium]|nr:glycosyltransferase family 4 protein [bacterium]
MLRNIFWKSYSRLLIVGDNSGWSTDEDAKDLQNICRELEVPAHIVKKVYFNIAQAVHYTSQFSLTQETIYHPKNRISVDYYHGKPEQQESFKKCFEAMIKHKDQIIRVRVSNREMETLIKSSGIEPEKVMRIPLGVDFKNMRQATSEMRQAARESLAIPADALVIGSFQKDGVGWGDGLEPKLIKGPDTFLKVIAKLKNDIPNLWVLLSGPARGFVKKGLEELGIPYRHEYFRNSKDVIKLYDALDLYLITSREEGGPKACLDSMAKGIPLVTTEVGQCKDLVTSGKNAMMAPIDDIEGIYRHSLHVLQDKELRKNITEAGIITARENSYETQLPLWRKYFDKLIEK